MHQIVYESIELMHFGSDRKWPPRSVQLPRPAFALIPRHPHDLIVPSKTKEIHSIFSACSRAFVLYFTTYVLPWLKFIIDDSEMRNGIWFNLIIAFSDCKTVYLFLIARNALTRRVNEAGFCGFTLLPSSVDSKMIAPIISKSSVETVKTTGCRVYTF